MDQQWHILLVGVLLTSIKPVDDVIDAVLVAVLDLDGDAVKTNNICGPLKTAELLPPSGVLNAKVTQSSSHLTLCSLALVPAVHVPIVPA